MTLAELNASLAGMPRVLKGFQISPRDKRYNRAEA